MRSSSESGQATIEAAVLLPVLFVVLGLIIQPALLLYTQCVMNAAASEGCRLVATNTNDDASVRAFVERRLSAIPAIPAFHSGSTWELEWSSASSGEATVRIVNHAEPLPLLGITAGLAGALDEDGTLRQEAHASSTTIPSWVEQQGYTPSDWINGWK